jgi:hypothetical protein
MTDNSPAKLADVSRRFSCFATRCFMFQRALIYKSGMIGTHMGHTVDQMLSQCMGRFVLYHAETVTSNILCQHFIPVVLRVFIFSSCVVIGHVSGCSSRESVLPSCDISQ